VRSIAREASAAPAATFKRRYRKSVESGPKPVVRLRESSGSAREADEVMRSDYTDFPITLEISFRDS